MEGKREIERGIEIKEERKGIKRSTIIDQTYLYLGSIFRFTRFFDKDSKHKL